MYLKNIFAGEEETFMIGDFGLSRMMRDASLDLHEDAVVFPRGVNSEAVHTAGVGTAAYASPEQVTTDDYDSSADISVLVSYCSSCSATSLQSTKEPRAFTTVAKEDWLRHG